MKGVLRIECKGSTLAEMLVVMILTGIILLSLFEGFTLFKRMARRAAGRIETGMEEAATRYDLERLVLSADSAAGDAERVTLFRKGGRTAISREDSLLTIIHSGAAGDTILRNVSSVRIVYSDSRTDLIDSMIVTCAGNELRLGVRYDNNVFAEEEARRIELKYEK